MTDTTQHGVERPDSILEGIGCDVWQAYNAMETTKRRHYELLEVLDNKKKNYNLEPSEAQKVLLNGLLKDHDEQVRRFTLASGHLKQTDSQAHVAVFGYISAINDLQSSAEQHH